MTISLQALHEKREQLKAVSNAVFVISVADLSLPDSASVASQTATVHRKTPRDMAPPTR